MQRNSSRTQAGAPATAEPTGLDVLLGPVLAGFDADDETIVRHAGHATCLLARECPEAVPELVGDLVDRATEQPEPGLLRTLSTLDESHRKQVQQAIVDQLGREGGRPLYKRIRAAEPWDRPERLQTGEAAEEASVFRRVVEMAERDAGSDSLSRPIQGDSGTSNVGPRRSGPSDTDAETRREAADIAAAAERASGDGPSEAAQRKEREIERISNSQLFSAIQMRSEFDDLEVVQPERDRRYGSALRTRAVREGEELGVAVRLPTTPEDAPTFQAELSEQLSAWGSLEDAPGVVALADWGERPEPWFATEYVEDTLAARERPSPAVGLAHAKRLANGLATLHSQNVVHGGIDPKNVAYTTDDLDGPREPMLDNVGLVSAYRQHVKPNAVLNPRYAAPEYFDRQYGRVDHATDVYQLGMVLFRLLTDRHPFTGDYEAVRESVLNDRPPAPSEVNPELPEAIDEVIAKATSKGKLARYETADRFHNELAAVCRRIGIGE